MLSVGGLFSGIGGIERGLESTGGFDVHWHAEIDPYCRRVLKRHWPNVTCYEDVHDALCGSWVDVLCGGFPCQPISQAAARSSRGEGWLWPKFSLAINLLQPRWVIVENVEALRYADRGLNRVLQDLASLGFDAEWRVVRASDLGAPHHRARVWVVAHSNRDSKPAFTVNDEVAWLSEPLEAVPGWRAVPDLRVADGVPDRVQRRSRLGNAVCPPVAAWVGRCILRTEERWLRQAAYEVEKEDW